MSTVLTFVSLTVIAWFSQNCLHELSHLVSGFILEGRRPLEFKPYPHFFNGRLYLASCRFSKEAKHSKYNWFVHIAPFWFGLIEAFISTLLLVLLSSVDSSVWYLPLPFLLCNLADASFFWVAGLFGSRFTDYAKYRYVRFEEPYKPM